MKKFYWQFEQNIRKNEKDIEDFVLDFFKDYIRTRKKCRSDYIKTLSFIVVHIFRLMKELEKEYNLEFLFENQYNFGIMNEYGLGLNFSRHKGKNLYYKYGDTIIKQRYIKLILDYFETVDLVRINKGYFCYNAGFNKQMEKGINYLNLKKWYDIYLSSNVDIEDNHQPIQIRENLNGKYIYTGNYDYLLYDMVDTYEYLNKLQNIYDNMVVRLSLYDKIDDTKKEKIREVYRSKLYKRCIKTGVHETYSEKQIDDEIIKIVDKANNRLIRTRFRPYRVYHYDNNQLSYGRIHGNHLDNMDNVCKQLLTINGEEATNIDIKSSVVQFYILEQCKNVNNNQDFYEYDGLKQYEREQRKLMIQCFNFNTNLLNALRAYNNICFNHGWKQLKKVELQNVLNNMLEQRPYLDGLFLNQNLICKKMFLKESEFMKEVSNNLINSNIPHILNSDAVWIPKSELNKALDTFRDTSINKYGRLIKVDIG